MLPCSVFTMPFALPSARYTFTSNVIKHLSGLSRCSFFSNNHLLLWGRSLALHSRKSHAHIRTHQIDTVSTRVDSCFLPTNYKHLTRHPAEEKREGCSPRFPHPSTRLEENKTGMPSKVTCHSFLPASNSVYPVLTMDLL